MKVFIDTNVMIDVIGSREPFYADAAKLFALAEHGVIQIAASSISYVNTFYVLRKYHSAKQLKSVLQKMRTICAIAAVSEMDIDKALLSDFDDFEDAVQYYAAIHDRSDVFVTRNKKDFKNATLPVMTPSEFIASIR